MPSPSRGNLPRYTHKSDGRRDEPARRSVRAQLVAIRSTLGAIVLLQLLNGLAFVPIELRPWLKAGLAFGAVLFIAWFLWARCLGLKPSLRETISLTTGQLFACVFIGAILQIALLMIDARATSFFTTVSLPFATYQPWTELEASRNHGLAAMALTSILLALSAAVLEEATYKSLLLQSIGWLTRGRFISISALLFAIVHIEYGLAWSALMGLFYGVPSAAYYYETRNLGPLLVIHFVMGIVADSYIFVM